MKELSVAKLKKKADAAYSTYVRLRDADDRGMVTCITCPTTRFYKQMQAGHFVSRRVNQLRFFEENVNGQCDGCNRWKHGEQYAYSKALDLKYGDGTADRLWGQRFSTHKFTKEELEEIIHDAKEATEFYLKRLKV